MPITKKNLCIGGARKQQASQPVFPALELGGQVVPGGAGLDGAGGAAGVRFEAGGETGDAEQRAFPLLDNIASVIQAHPEIEQIRIEGHTDRTGSLDFNMRLSKARATSVVDYLVSKGVSKDRLLAEGFGPTRPLVPDAKTKAALAQNRRVEFHIVEPKADSP